MQDTIFGYIDREYNRQRQGAEIIASENYVSEAVLRASGSILTNKYSEGYPGKRYYAGNEWIDAIEKEAQERVKQLFGVPYVNVQPHSGSNANLAACMALLVPGDTIMGLELKSGGHLTHGHHVSASGIFFRSQSYGVNPEGWLDYDMIREQAIRERPKLIICGYTAYPRIFDYEAFRRIADEVGAYLLADVSHIAGLIVGGVFENPAPWCDVITTTTHKTLRGPRGGVILSRDPVIAKKIDAAVFPGLQGGPLDHIVAAKAIAFKEALQPSFSEYAKQILLNTQAFSRVFQEESIKMVTGGSDNHLLVLDLRSVGIDGTCGEAILASCDIMCNKNTVPDETGSAFRPSGIRIGSAAVTTRGLKEVDCTWLAGIIVQALKHPKESALHTTLKKQINARMQEFSLFAESV